MSTKLVFGAPNFAGSAIGIALGISRLMRAQPVSTSAVRAHLAWYSRSVVTSD